MKILFIYPNLNSQPRIPAGPAILIGILKIHGHEVVLYDTTFTNCNYNASTSVREDQKTVLRTDLYKYIGETKRVDHRVELTKILNAFRPDLVCMNSAEHNYKFGMQLLKIIKECGEFPILVGGIFPTICPETVINNQYVDMICVGEGEEVIIDVCERLAQKKSMKGIYNIWYKEGGKIYRSSARLIQNLDAVPYQDWEIFDKRHLWKAFVGKVWKSGGFELSRGCLNTCSFCVENQKRKNTIGNDKKWRRIKSPQAVISEIKYFKDRHGLELLAFGDMNFLSQSVETVRSFSESYSKEIGLPFIIQSSVETLVSEEKVRLLKEMNCVTISLGIESGLEETRRMVLNKRISNDHIFKAFANAKKYKIRTTANYILGLPYDTEEKIKKTIEFNLQLMPDSVDVYYYIPFLGTSLYDLCKKEGFIPEGAEIGADILSKPYLNLPGLSHGRLQELHKEFVESYIERFEELNMKQGIL